MGKKPDEIEREIEQQRLEISQKLDRLQGRVQHDIEAVKSTASEEVNTMFGRATGAFDIKRQAEEHPLTLMAGGLGLGVLLGAASEGRSNGGHSSSGKNGGRGDSLFGEALGAFSGPTSRRAAGSWRSRYCAAAGATTRPTWSSSNGKAAWA